MVDLKPGDPIQHKPYSFSDDPGVVVSVDADSLLLLNPGVRSVEHPVLRRFRNSGILPPGGSHPSSRPVFQGKEERPLNLTAHPWVFARPGTFDDAALALVEAAAPGEAESLRRAPTEEILVYCGDFSSAKRNRTRRAFRLAAAVHEFESRDMVMLDWDWRWMVLSEPLIVAGQFLGGSRDWARLYTAEGVPPAAVAAFFAAVAKS